MKNSIVCLVILFLACCNSEDKTKVQYKVICASGCNITYEMAGNVSQEFGRSGSWSIHYKGKSGEMLYLSALKTSLFGKATVTIYLDGKQFKTAETDATFDFATVSGLIP